MGDEIILALARSHPETDDLLSRQAYDQNRRWELGLMVAVIVLLGLFSAGIFLVHAIKAYQAQ